MQMNEPWKDTPIYAYIDKNFDLCVHENTQDTGNLIGMPKPYTVPCVGGAFQEMYYWDTYFANVGLILCGKLEQAKNNVENMLYMVERFGYMPNGNRTYYLKSSQPPFLSLMVREVYEQTGDKAWLAGAVKTLEKEHHFWIARRQTPCVLSRYGANREFCPDTGLAGALRERLGINPPIKTDDLMVDHFIAGAESGWDFNPRTEFEAFNYAEVDLNSLLYALESNIAYFYTELGSADSETWQTRAQERAERMRQLMKGADGCYYDYNFMQDRLSPVFSAASYYPLFVGLVNEEEAKAALAALPRIELAHGVATCAKNDAPCTYQWDYPGYGALSYLHYYEFFNKFESPDKLVNALRRALSVPGDTPVEPTDLTLQGSRMTYALNSCDITCIELFGRQVAVTDLLGKTQVYAVRHNAFQELCDQVEKLEDGCLQQIHRCIIINTRRIRQIEWEKNTATVWLFNMDEGKPAGKTYVRRLDIFRR